MSNSRVLLISYWFPPAGGIAVQRALSLAKYLPQYGCEVHVLAPKNPPSPVLDPSLLQQIPDHVKVHRAWTPMPSSELRKKLWRRFSGKQANAADANSTGAGKKGSGRISSLARTILCPDPEVVWVPFAIRRAVRIVKQEKIDAAIVTAPPFSAFLIGNSLKRNFPQLRLISDFRDEWLRFFLSAFEFQDSAYIRRRAESIERQTVELSDDVVTVTLPLVRELQSRYGDLPSSKFVHIPNGYDPAMFDGFRHRPHGISKIVVTYVGTVYNMTSPKAYFQGLDALPESLRSSIETRFIGRVAEEQRGLLASRSDVKLYGYMSQAEAFRYMEETDYLLLTMSDPTATTGKIYEYLATGKPILAFSPSSGEVAKTIDETKGGWCLDPDDPIAIRDCMQRMAEGMLAGSFDPDIASTRNYERPRLAEKFASLIKASRGVGSEFEHFEMRIG